MTRGDIDPAALADVADWPALTSEREAELRRILLGAQTAGSTSTGEKSTRRNTRSTAERKSA